MGIFVEITARLIFIFFAGVYILTIGTPFYSIDAQTMYDTSRALAFEQTIAFPPDFISPQLKPGRDGRLYSQYDPGLPLIAAPVVHWSDSLAKSQLWNRYAFSAYMVEWIPALFAAAGLCGLYALAETKKKGLLAVVAAGLCTPLWPYARMFFPEGTLAGLLMLAFWGAYRGGWWGNLGAGAALGLMILIRAPAGIYVPPIVWLAGSKGLSDIPEKRGKALTLILRYGSLLFFPFLAGLVLLYHNFIRYGDVFTSGYSYSGQAFNTPLWEGVYGMLLSPGKGVFWYAPLLFVSVWKFPVFYRKNPRLAQAILLATAGVLLLYGRWWAWHGGWCWGPRFLVPILPLWMLPLGEFHPPDSKKWVGFVFLLVLSFFIALLGVITNVNTTYEAHPEDVVHYTIGGSPIIGAVEIVLDTRTEYLSTFYLGRIGMVNSSAVLVPTVLVLCVTGSGFLIAKTVNHE